MAARQATTAGSHRRSDYLVIALTLGLFAAACCLPTVDEGRYSLTVLAEGPDVEGADVGLGLIDLLFGWLSCHPAWLANPALLVALVLFLLGWRTGAAAAGGLSAAPGITAGVSFWRDGLYAGYYAWQASQLVLAAGAWRACLRERRRPTGADEVSRRGSRTAGDRP